jgi:hypothetical protein
MQVYMQRSTVRVRGSLGLGRESVGPRTRPLDGTAHGLISMHKRVRTQGVSFQRACFSLREKRER